MIEDVLQFWFGTLHDERTIPERSKYWFVKDQSFDDSIRKKFSTLLDDAKNGKLIDWELSHKGALALTIIRDQFSRNLFRNSPKAFEQDAAALNLTLKMISENKDKKYFPVERAFIYLPLEHSESLDIQKLSVSKFQELTNSAPNEIKAYFEDTLLYAKRHHEIIERFGRFPHRNEVLNRVSTAEEITFLNEPMSSF
jgi:uncharacterized protein (DUF924 family)